MKIAIDFDGVIVERYGIPTKGHEFNNCPPTEDCEDAIKFLKKLGHELYIFTNRPKEEWKTISKWLKDNHIPNMRITNIKELGTTIYLDDRAVRFDNWRNICKLFG